MWRNGKDPALLIHWDLHNLRIVNCCLKGSGHTKPGIMDLQRAECSQVGSFEGVASKVVIFQRIFVSQEHGSVPAH